MNVDLGESDERTSLVTGRIADINARIKEAVQAELIAKLKKSVATIASIHNEMGGSLINIRSMVIENVKLI